MVELNDYLNGFTALLVVIFCVSQSIGYYIRTIRLVAKLLKWGAGMGLFTGLLWLGPTTDFLLILITGNHISYYFDISIYSVISYIWVGPSLICDIYVGSELIAPEKKKVLFTFFISLTIVFTIFLIIDRKNTFTFTKNEGDLIDAQFVYLFPSIILICIFLTFILFFNGFGALNKAIKTTGEIRKRFIYFTINFFLFIIVAIFDAFINANIYGILYIIRLCMICCAWLTYISVKP